MAEEKKSEIKEEIKPLAKEQTKPEHKEARKKEKLISKKAMDKIADDKAAQRLSKDGDCGDDRCPKHGHLRTKGRIFQGKVVSLRARKTAVVEIQYLRHVPKYERYEKRKTKLHVHIPDCYKINEGDMVKFMECRKISKTKAFVIID